MQRLPKRRRCSTKTPAMDDFHRTCKSLAKGQLFSIVKYPQFDKRSVFRKTLPFPALAQYSFYFRVDSRTVNYIFTVAKNINHIFSGSLWR